MSRSCANPDCNQPVPHGRLMYCSNVCADRVRKRRYKGRHIGSGKLAIEALSIPTIFDTEFPSHNLEDRSSQPSPHDLFEAYRSIDPILITRAQEGERSLFLSDIHVPFADRAALRMVSAFMYDWCPDRVFYIGDIMDCYGISRFDKNPTRRFSLQNERDWVGGILDEHAKICPDAKRYFIDGNHEERLLRFLWERAPELANLRTKNDDLVLSIPELLFLKDRGIEYTGYAGYVDYLGFLVAHGELLSKHSSYTAKQMSEKHRSSGISGHSHRLGMFNWTGVKGPQAWYENGCLCRLDPDYTHAPNWQQGLHVGVVVNQRVHVLPGIIFDNCLYIEGKVYR